MLASGDGVHAGAPHKCGSRWSVFILLCAQFKAGVALLPTAAQLRGALHQRAPRAADGAALPHDFGASHGQAVE